MHTEKLFLRPNIQVEPLIDHWYAWTHLISPATAARNITERHMNIMNSYINAPQVHISATKNPKLLGGPFIDYEQRRVEEIKELRDRIKKERVHLFELSAALAALDELLRTSAKGYSLQPLYRTIPSILQGFVEVAYDLNNNASYRLIEPLLYKSKYYDRSMQSIMLSTISADDRPFMLSTPRLPSADSIHLRVPFNDKAVDWLFQLKSEPQTWPRIKEELCLPDTDDALFRTFLTTDPPPRYTPYTGDGVRWRYFGHACILVETKTTTMLFDPVLSYTYESQVSRYTYLDLPDTIDYVLITHNHQDHVMFETLLQLRHKIKSVIVPRNGGGELQDPSLKLTLQYAGFRNVYELDELEDIKFPNGSITGMPFLGEHADLDIRTKLGYLIRFGARSLYFAADSCNIEPAMYDHVHHEIGDIDALFLGMECDGAPLSWLYGPLLSRRLERALDESRRLSGSNFEQGMGIVSRFNCKDVYVYAMGLEPWLTYLLSLKYTDESRPIVESNRLIKACHDQGISAERLFGEKEILLSPN